MQDCEEALSQHQGETLTEGLGKTAKKDPVTSAAEECISNLRSEFQTRMSDDLNTAHILTGAFQEALKFINSTLTSLKVQFFFLRESCTSSMLGICLIPLLKSFNLIKLNFVLE